MVEPVERKSPEDFKARILKIEFEKFLITIVVGLTNSKIFNLPY